MEKFKDKYPITTCYLTSLITLTILAFVCSGFDTKAIGYSIVLGGVYFIPINTCYIILISLFKRYRWTLKNKCYIVLETISVCYIGELYDTITYHFLPSYRWKMWVSMAFVYTMQTILLILYPYIKSYKSLNFKNMKRQHRTIGAITFNQIFGFATEAA